MHFTLHFLQKKMNTFILKGYLLKDVSSVADLEMLLYEMRDIIQKRASVAYGELVKWQTERIVDEIALNQIRRPEDCSILDMAAKEVRRRIIDAEKYMRCTEFNLYIGTQVLTGTYEKKPVLYLKIICQNDIYSKYLKKIEELIPMDITEEDLKAGNNAKKALWESMEQKYQTDIPLIGTLIQYDELAIHPENFQFRSPKERASDIAKEKILNQLLAAYACDQQVPPNKLMEYTLQGINRLKYKDIQYLLGCEEEHLSQILPVIDNDMVAKIGILPVPGDTEDNTVEEDPC